jgi:hypothetical protein
VVQDNAGRLSAALNERLVLFASAMVIIR